jgi:hypothetical protein
LPAATVVDRGAGEPDGDGGIERYRDLGDKAVV